jgi:NAD(P)-dependent dehydrogenase (short-subunit alcohol dehydrogenase family)
MAPPMTGVVNSEIKIDTSSTIDIKDKKVLVVGGTSGLGQAIALESVKKGAKVCVVGRSFKDDPNQIDFIKADLSLMKEAKRIGETVEPADLVVLTTGIIPYGNRTTSEEGIEMDMAVSYLSRLVLLKYLVPRLNKGSRVFIMGFPGSNQKNFNLEDLNSEKSYESGMGFVHMNTVAGNEALVLHWAAKTKSEDVAFFGLNPGIIKTGIRDNLYAGGIMAYLGPIIEFLIGLVAQTPQNYAEVIVPLLFAENIEGYSGSMFNPKAQATFKSKHFEEDENLVKKVIDGSEALIKEKTAIELPN